MNGRLFCLSLTMATDERRAQEIKLHIHRLLEELRLMEPDETYLEHFKALNDTLLSQNDSTSNQRCWYLSAKSNQPAILHSTTYSAYGKANQRKSNRKRPVGVSGRVTSTPKKHSPRSSLFLQPYHTSTPRQSERPPTTKSIHRIPLKRLLFHQKDHHRQRQSPIGFASKRSMLPNHRPLNLMDAHPLWI